MAFRGQFKSQGGQGSPLLLSKSKLLSSKRLVSIPIYESYVLIMIIYPIFYPKY